MIGVDEFRQREGQWREHFDRVRAVNHHLRLIADQVGEGAVIVEAEAGRGVGPRIVFANRAAGVLTGRKADDLVGEQLGVIYEPDELAHLVSRLPAVAKGNKTYQMEKGAVLADGSVVPFRWSVRPVRDERGQTVNFLLTLRPREDDSAAALSSVEGGGSEGGSGKAVESGSGAEEDERQLAARLEKCRIESLAQLAGGIAHDFNNVLTSIFSHLSLAKLASAPDGEVRAHIVDALEASQNAQSLAQQILDFTKGKLQNNQLVDMGKVVQQAAKLSTMGSKVRYDVQIAEEVWGVEGDLGQVRQVIHNFLINAGQAMPEGGVVQAMVRNVVVDEQHPVGDLPPGGYVMAGVRDRGCGISQENLERIFEPYFTTKETGSGIGLATCRTIAQRHKGCITVKSKLEAYSEFRLYLPACLIEADNDTGPIHPAEARAESGEGGAGIAEAEGKGNLEDFPRAEENAERISRPKLRGETGTGVPSPILPPLYSTTTDGQGGQQVPPADAVIRGQGRVLVVDDQDDVRIAASLLLERLGYRTVAASDGQSAVRTYRQQLETDDPISAVLLDMTLPGGLSGDEVMEEVLKLDPQARVIATSGWFDEDAEERFQLDGYVGILPKPYAVESLSQKLHEALTRS
jgi:PAS domain S-box-containing protein